MDYSDLQKTEFRKKFQTRRRTQLLVVMLFFLALLILAVIGRGEAEWRTSNRQAGYYLPVTMMLATGILSFSLYNWRCPACGKSPGYSPSPRFCRRCGVPFR